jgi:hypothetical protein
MNKSRFEWVSGWASCLLLTLVVALLKFQFHELWKDEWQAWFVARDMSFGQIFSFLYYEGHPALWYVYLKMMTPFTFVASEEVLLSVAHLLIVFASSWLLFVKHRASLLLKWLFALSYFFLFEYGVINRGYALVVALSLAVSWFIRNDKAETRAMAVMLFLLCQTEVYGAIMAMAFGFFLWAEAGYRNSFLTTTPMKALALGQVLFLVSVFPRTAGHVAKTKGKELSVLDSWLTSLQGNLSNAYLPGSTKDTFVYGWTMPGLALSLLVVVGIYWLFRKNKPQLLSMAFFTAMMIAFGAVFFLGGIRQWGMGYVFMLSLFLVKGFDMTREKTATVFLVVVGVINMIHGFRAVREDIRLPFTNAKQAGIFIKEKVPEMVPVVAINKFETAPVGGYANRKFYELPTGQPFSYFRWVDKIYLPTEGELKLFARYKKVGGLVIISPQPLSSDRFPGAQLWQQFTSINYKDENYFLYSLPVK